MKLEDIKTIDDAQNYCDAIINDFEGGIIDKDKASYLLGEYTARIMELWWENTKAMAKKDLQILDRLFTDHIDGD